MRNQAIVLRAGGVLLVAALAAAAAGATPPAAGAAHWWVGTAFATCLLLWSPRRQWPALLLGIALATLLGNQVGGRGDWHSVVSAAGNTLEAGAVASILVRRSARGRPTLGTWGDFWTFALAISAGTLLNALVVTALRSWQLPLEDVTGIGVWLLVNHVAAQALIVPIALARPRHEPVNTTEVVVHLAFVAVAAVVFLGPGTARPHALFLVPLLVWSAARFPTPWAHVELLATAFAVNLMTGLGRGPFQVPTAPPSLSDAMAGAQVFLGTSALLALAFATSVTQERETARRMLATEAKARKLLDAAQGTAFIAIDLAGTVIVFNPAAERVLGYRSTDVIGIRNVIDFHDPGEVLERSLALGCPADFRVLIHGAEGDRADERDWTVLCRDGTRKIVTLSTTAVRDRQGVATSYLSIVHDVTDQRTSQRRLVSALEKEREATLRMNELDRAKVEFVSTVSHELRTPLTSIMGYTELLEEGITGSLSATQVELVDRIERNSERLLLLVEDLLTMARVEDGSFAMSARSTDLRTAVLSAVEMLMPLARTGEVLLTVRLPEHPISVTGDDDHLERLAHNLIGNAIKFTPPGGEVRVSLSAQHDTSSGASPHARFEIADNGVGIPVEDQGKIFQRFFRSSIAHDLAIQGSGLGLSIVSTIAAAHDGRVEFESRPGEGSTFWFTIPVDQHTQKDTQKDTITGGGAEFSAPDERPGGFDTAWARL